MQNAYAKQHDTMSKVCCINHVSNLIEKHGSSLLSDLIHVLGFGIQIFGFIFLCLLPSHYIYFNRSLKNILENNKKWYAILSYARIQTDLLEF